jgi:uncharacterized caspase-like protein
MDNCSSRRQVLILDCCHSGAFARGTKGAPGASVSTATAFECNGFGRVVLTATDATQYAWDGDKVLGGRELPTSVFTRHLIEGLRRQTPGKWSYKQQGNLIIARNPYPGRKTASLPEHLLKALEVCQFCSG